MNLNAGLRQASASANDSVLKPPDQLGYSTKGRELRLIALIALLATATSFWYFNRFHNFYTPDSPSYIAPAHNLVAGHGFTDAENNPETLRTPGYPLLMVPFLWARLDFKYIIIFQHIVRVFVILATTIFALGVTRSLRQALVAGVFLCLDLPLLEAANSIMTELAFTAILLCILWLLWTASQQQEPGWVRWIVAGFLAGASALIRPVSLFIFLPLALYLLLARRRSWMRAIVVFFLSFVCLPLLWMARNESQTGRFTFSSIAGINMLFYRAAGTLAIDDPGSFAMNFDKRQQQLQKEACDEARNLYPNGCIDFRLPQKGGTDKAEYFSRLGRKIVLQRPLAYVKLAFRGAVLMMLDGGAVVFSQATGINPHLALRLLLGYTLPMFCFALIGERQLWKENRALFYLTSLIILYFIIISAGAEAYSRLRVPIDPIYALAIGVGFDFCLSRVAAWRGKYSQ